MQSIRKSLIWLLGVIGQLSTAIGLKLPEVRSNSEGVQKAAFIVGVAMVAWFVNMAWEGLGGQIKYVFSKATAQTQETAYDCRNAECSRCLTSIDENPDAVLMLGGSGAEYGFDFATLQKSLPKKIASCVVMGFARGTYTLTTYLAILNQKNKLKASQSILFGINSWLLLDLDGQTPEPASVFRQRDIEVGPPPPPEISTLLPIIVNRHFWSLQIRQRNKLRAAAPRLASVVSLLPFLSLERHLSAKIELMKRWVRTSPWSQSFLPMTMGALSETEIRDRLRRLKAGLDPVSNIYVFPIPEFTDLLIYGHEEEYRSSLARFRRAATALDFKFVDVDYKACGIDLSDFWSAGIYSIDPVHVGYATQAKTTKCLVEAIQRSQLVPQL